MLVLVLTITTPSCGSSSPCGWYCSEEGIMSQYLLYLRQMRKLGLSPSSSDHHRFHCMVRKLYTAISHKALQRVLQMAQHITEGEHEGHVYLRKAQRISKDSYQQSHRLFLQNHILDKQGFSTVSFIRLDSQGFFFHQKHPPLMQFTAYSHHNNTIIQPNIVLPTMPYIKFLLRF